MVSMFDATSRESQQLEIRTLDQSDEQALQSYLLKEFITYEPLSVSIGLKSTEAEPLVKYHCQEGVSSQMSLAYYDQKGDIVAVRLCSALSRPSAELKTCNDSVEKETKSEFPEKIAKIATLLGELENKVWELLSPKYTNLISLLILSSSHHYARRGLASKLMTFDIEKLKEKYDGIVTVATSFKSQNMLAKLGYRTLAETKLSDWKNAQNRQIFICDDGTTSAKLMFLDFLAK
ncbi:hypothetical protein AB6A40_001235 [Gnathostoma spinigerum]|uniref:aralkylamine N-acetyltransferase n=1 Tax=Gnathostoma spinigerum TaxID=75299 RepID=A0ABD6E4Z1_9BILA